jgi:hypothetical protein
MLIGAARNLVTTSRIIKMHLHRAILNIGVRMLLFTGAFVLTKILIHGTADSLWPVFAYMLFAILFWFIISYFIAVYFPNVHVPFVKKSHFCLLMVAVVLVTILYML